MKKTFLKILSLVLIISLFTPTIAFGDELKDIELSPYKQEIRDLVSDNIILGYSDKTFRPEGTITRAELASILTKAMKLEEDKEEGRHFTDVVGKWFEGTVGAIFKKGIMIGKSKMLFAPNDKITKEEMAVLLLRAFELEKTANELNLELKFGDNDKISSWSKNSVALAYNVELMDATTNEDGSILFIPKAFVDRQTVAKLVYELIYNKAIYKKRLDIIIAAKSKDNTKEQTKDDIKEQTKEKEDEDIKKDKPTYDFIVSKYDSKLRSLESKYIGMLEDLFSEAKAEYYQNKGNPNFSVTELYQKYEEKGRVLESEADGQVSSALSQLKMELIENGYDTSIVDEFQQRYEDKKSSLEL